MEYTFFDLKIMVRTWINSLPSQVNIEKSSDLIKTTVYLNSVTNETLNLQFFVVIGESYGKKERKCLSNGIDIELKSECEQNPIS